MSLYYDDSNEEKIIASRLWDVAQETVMVCKREVLGIILSFTKQKISTTPSSQTLPAIQKEIIKNDNLLFKYGFNKLLKFNEKHKQLNSS